MSDDLRACCGNCDAWQRERGDNGICRAKPPQVVVLGTKQERPVMRLPGQPPVITSPVLSAYFPPMSRKAWCREWAPTGDFEKVFNARQAAPEASPAAPQGLPGSNGEGA